MSKTNRGTPWPIGSSLTSRGVNFSVAAPQAEYLELLLYENENDLNPHEVIELREENHSGDYWHIEVEGLEEGALYGYRVFFHGSNSLKKTFATKILLDPCARGISGWGIYNRKNYLNKEENSKSCLKAVVTERTRFDFYNHPRPKHPWHKTIIYELHVSGFTKTESTGVDESIKGTFLGLIKKIPYLKDLGITTIELLPIFSFDSSDSPLGLQNYWGYSPINWFTPHHEYITNKDSIKARQEFKEFVAACHDNDLEVILDVVYNHTTEGNQNGPLISWKGFADEEYYYQDKKGNYLDVTGCGNTIAANRPLVRRLILESIKCWANELGVDGFRFDLGIALSRGEDLTPLESPPFFEELESDPSLSELKLISEPWDCGGLYKISNFPSKKMCTWNGYFRDDIRKFWKGDKNSTWPLKDRLIGSPDLYKDNKKSVSKSINFITSHDGFTLNDLVSFNIKHNYSNGENNRDGDNNNNSWNHGKEGPTDDLEIELIRKKQKKNFLSSLLLSHGIPMILMGDEIGRSQGGNNNSWCQNTSLGWMVWDKGKSDLELKDFVKNLIFIRSKLSDLFSPPINLTTEDSLVKNEQDAWIEWHGIKTNAPDWGSWSHTISYSIHKENQGALAWLGLNAYNESMQFELPKASSPWMKLLDTNSSSINFSRPTTLSNQKQIEIESRSFSLIVTKNYSKKLQ